MPLLGPLRREGRARQVEALEAHATAIEGEPGARRVLRKRPDAPDQGKHVGMDLRDVEQIIAIADPLQIGFLLHHRHAGEVVRPGMKSTNVRPDVLRQGRPVEELPRRLRKSASCDQPVLSKGLAVEERPSHHPPAAERA